MEIAVHGDEHALALIILRFGPILRRHGQTEFLPSSSMYFTVDRTRFCPLVQLQLVLLDG